MHDHDELLIIDLLENPSLSDEGARARLEGCAECIADLDAQRSVMMMLDQLPPATMTEAERHTLRRQVDDELGSPDIVALPGRWRWDWARLGAVAAAMLGVFVIGGIVANLGSGDETVAGPTTMAAASEESTTRENESFAADSAEVMEDPATADDGAGIASLAPESGFVRDLGPIDAAAFASEVEALSEQIRSSDESVSSGTLNGVGETCLEQIDDPSTLRGALLAAVDGTPVAAYFDSEGTPTAFSTTDCSPYPLP